MSWDAYTKRLVESHVELCAIHGRDGAPWAQVPCFTCTPDEVAKVATVIANNDMNIYGTGALVGGKRWTVIKLDPDAQVLVMKGKDPDNNKQTLVLALSNTAIVIGANRDENVQGSAVVVAIEGMRDYLKNSGY